MFFLLLGLTYEVWGSAQGHLRDVPENTHVQKHLEAKKCATFKALTQSPRPISTRSIKLCCSKWNEV